MIYISLSFLIILSLSLFFLDKNKNNQKGLYEKVNIDNQVYFDEVNTKLKEIISINNFEKTCEKRHEPFEKYLNKILESEIGISPIKSLAVHMTNINSSYGLSPFIDIKKLWEENKIGQ